MGNGWVDRMDELELIERNREKNGGSDTSSSGVGGGGSVLGCDLVVGEEIPITVLKLLKTRVGWVCWHWILVMAGAVLLGFFVGVNW